MVESTAALCARHADASAVATCTRCGSFLCGECLEVVGESAFCAPCVSLRRSEGPVSRAAWGALALGVMGLLTLPCSLALPLPPLVAGVGSVVLGMREAGRIRRGESPEKGRVPARVAYVLGWLNLGLLAAWLLGWGWLYFAASGARG
ncbi:B-box zinc finger protein [Corallococcus terminator]